MDKKTETKKKQRPLNIRTGRKESESDFERDLESGDNPEERENMYPGNKEKKKK
jgi:hypothetical protein